MGQVDLKNIPLFAGLDNATGKHLISIAKRKSYKKGEIIFNRGDTGSTLFLLISGSVKISLIDKGGKEVILKILYGGDFFGEISLLDGGFRSTSVMALELCKSLIIHQNEFNSLIKKYPEIAIPVMLSLSRRLRELDKKVGNLVLSNSIGKVASLIVEMAEEKGKKKNGEPYFKTNLTRQEMANLLGITRETFTRCLQTFQERNVIAVAGKEVTIKDVIALRCEMF